MQSSNDISTTPCNTTTHNVITTLRNEVATLRNKSSQRISDLETHRDVLLAEVDALNQQSADKAQLQKRMDALAAKQQQCDTLISQLIDERDSAQDEVAALLANLQTTRDDLQLRSQQALTAQQNFAALQVEKEKVDAVVLDLHNKVQAAQETTVQLRDELKTCELRAAQATQAFDKRFQELQRSAEDSKRTFQEKLARFETENARLRIQISEQTTVGASTLHLSTATPPAPSENSHHQLLQVLLQQQQQAMDVNCSLINHLQRTEPSSQNRSASIKAPTFDPAVYDWEVYEARFLEHCRFNQLPEGERLPVLLNALNNDAYCALFEAGLTDPAEWQAITKFLRNMYSQRRRPEDYESDFNNATRREGESLLQLAERLQALKRRANLSSTPHSLALRFLGAIGKNEWTDYLNKTMLDHGVSDFDKFL